MKKAIHEYIQSSRNEIVKMLSDMVRIPSVASDGAKGAVFGRDVAKMLAHTEGLFKSEGLKTFKNADNAYIIGRTEGSEKVIGIFAHGDVVAAAEEDWTVTKPFAPLEKDGFLYGRGAEDNKSGIVSAIWALKAMKHAGAMPRSTLLFYVGGNEEGGMCDLEYFAKNEKMPDFSIVPDNEYPVCRGEKGILRFWADFKTPFKKIISITGGQSLNIVLGSAKCEMRYSDKLLSELRAACSGNDAYTVTAGDKITLTAKGRSTHAAYSADSVNALYVLIQALKACPSLDGDLDILKAAEPLVADPFSEALGLGTADPDFSKTTCTTGVVKTENGKLTLSFDSRYGGCADIDKTLLGYEKYLTKVNAAMRITERDDGYIIPADSDIIKAMEDAYSSVTGEHKPPVVSYGGTYARHLSNAVSIGTYISKREAPALPDGHGGIHQPDELIDIDGLLRSIEVITHMILRADETLY